MERYQRPAALRCRRRRNDARFVRAPEAFADQALQACADHLDVLVVTLLLGIHRAQNGSRLCTLSSMALLSTGWSRV